MIILARKITISNMVEKFKNVLKFIEVFRINLQFFKPTFYVTFKFLVLN